MTYYIQKDAVEGKGIFRKLDVLGHAPEFRSKIETIKYLIAGGGGM